MPSDAAPKKVFPPGMEPIGNGTFRFACHPGVSCYMQCCRDQNLFLYPFDVIRLKLRLGISSEQFLEQHAMVVRGDNPFFPAVQLKMADNPRKTCPFLGDDGCTVYEARPNACRTYPLERAVSRATVGGRLEEYYFLTRHPYCKGHEERQEWRVKEWLRDQRLMLDNPLADRWAEMDTFFAGNPWRGEGAAGPAQRLAFMVCYNIDAFRRYAGEHGLLEQYQLDKARRRQIMTDDQALLQFGYDWLRHVLADQPTLQVKG